MKKGKKPKKEKKEGALSSSLPTEEKALPQDPLAYANKKAGGKWKLRILWSLRDKQNKRYGDLKRQITGITDMMLSQSLKELVLDGYVARTQYQEIPPRVEYAITKEGLALIPIIAQIVDWAARDMQQP